MEKKIFSFTKEMAGRFLSTEQALALICDDSTELESDSASENLAVEEEHSAGLSPEEEIPNTSEITVEDAHFSDIASEDSTCSSSSASPSGDEESSSTCSDEESSDSSVQDDGKVTQRGRYTRCRGGRGRLSGIRGARSHVRTYKSSKTSNATSMSSSFPDKCVSITVKDESFQRPISNEFCPLRECGPHFPQNYEITPLSLFELYFDNEVVERILHCSLAYAESRKNSYPVTYKAFTNLPFNKENLFAFVGSLLLLGIHGVRNYRHAWSSKSAQVLVRLDELLTCRSYEVIGTFLHLVTPDEESNMSDNKLKKVLPFYNYVKSKCFELYQPLQQLSVDERMVKTKARTQFRQYIRNKPTKWGMKYWVLADCSGYTVDFNLYAGKSVISSGKGLSFDVVTELIAPFAFQGYEIYIDNFYTSPVLLEHLLDYGIVATGTLNVSRKNVPSEVVTLKKAVEKRNITRGTGYYFRCPESDITYCVWHDTKTVTLASTAFPGHSESTVVRRVKDRASGICSAQDVPCPLMLAKYNQSMGGVDKSGQYISYHCVLRRTIKYWKTIFYHLLDIITVNSYILYNWHKVLIGSKKLSENRFRDMLILEIIAKYGEQKRDISASSLSIPSRSCKIQHGSKPYSTSERCVYCGLHGKRSVTQRKCSDCPLQPALCQVLGRDCHSDWHSNSFAKIRQLWYEHIERKSTQPNSSGRGRGRPRGSVNRRRRRGNYRRNYVADNSNM